MSTCNAKSFFCDANRPCRIARCQRTGNLIDGFCQSHAFLTPYVSVETMNVSEDVKHDYKSDIDAIHQSNMNLFDELSRSLQFIKDKLFELEQNIAATEIAVKKEKKDKNAKLKELKKRSSLLNSSSGSREEKQEFLQKVKQLEKDIAELTTQELAQAQLRQSCHNKLQELEQQTIVNKQTFLQAEQEYEKFNVQYEQSKAKRPRETESKMQTIQTPIPEEVALPEESEDEDEGPRKVRLRTG